LLLLGVTKDIALTAAKREAEIIDSIRATGGGTVEDNRRRKWDCFYIATAQCLGCSFLYTTDEKLIKRQKQLNLTDIRILVPKPSNLTLDLPPVSLTTPSQPAIVQPEANAEDKNPKKPN